MFGALGALVYLCAWPVAVDPVAWQPPPAPAPDGPFAPNRKLAGFTLLAPELRGPESIAVDAQGALYTGTLDGKVVRVDRSGEAHTLVQLEGRAAGRACARRRQSRRRGRPAGCPLAHRSQDRPPHGRDARRRLSRAPLRVRRRHRAAARRDLALHRSQHSLRCRRVRARRSRTPSFRQPVRVRSADPIRRARALGARVRVRRVFLSGPRKGQSDIVIDNLPGFPDNVTYDRERDLFWVALASRRDAGLDAISGLPFVRKMVARLPKPLRPGPKRHAMAVAIRDDGTRVGYFDDPRRESYSPVTSVLAAGGSLYLGSLSHGGIGRVPIPELETTGL